MLDCTVTRTDIEKVCEDWLHHPNQDIEVLIDRLSDLLILGEPMAMSRKHFVAVAKTIRDSDAFDSHSSRVQFAREMADAMADPDLGVRNFDRETFLAFATSDTEQ